MAIADELIIDYSPVKVKPQSDDGPALATDLEQIIRRHVVIDANQIARVIAWVFAAHLAVQIIPPRLVIVSSEPRSGVTTLLRLISYLVPRPLLSSGMTLAALDYILREARHVLLIDAAEKLFCRPNVRAREFRALLKTPRGTALPIAIAASGGFSLPDFGRSIQVCCAPKPKFETVEKLVDDDPALAALRSRIEIWCRDHRSRFQ